MTGSNALRAVRSCVRLGLLSGVLLCVLLVFSQAARATVTLDQAQTTTSGVEVTVAGSHRAAQTFTAGISGSLEEVDVFMFRVGNPGDLTVEIRDVSSGVPSGTVLGQGKAPQESVGETFSWIAIPLTIPAPVAAGTKYAITVSASMAAGFPTALYAWNYVFGNPYPAGEAWLSLTGGSTWDLWNPAPGLTDTAFKTYVNAVPKSIAECIDGRWEAFSQFKNQGDCVSYVATKGKNLPG